MQNSGQKQTVAYAAVNNKPLANARIVLNNKLLANAKTACQQKIAS